MIIDSHTHIGSIACFHLSEHTLIDSMRRYGIDFAIVSNLEGIEYISPHEKIERQVPQMDLNRRRCLQAHADILRMLFWIKQNTEGMTEARSFISATRAHGIENTSIPFTAHFHERYLYLDAACEMRLPIEVHELRRILTAVRPARYRRAIRRLILSWCMGLGTDNCESIDLIRSLPNQPATPHGYHLIRRYAPSGNAAPQNLFGTDSPIDGSGTYERYARHCAPSGTSSPPVRRTTRQRP